MTCWKSLLHYQNQKIVLGLVTNSEEIYYYVKLIIPKRELFLGAVITFT